jgi:hypothetical protein
MLVAVPLRNQLAEPTTDKRPDEGAHKNCVAACVAAVLTWATGRDWYGDQCHDAVYGEGYYGGQDPAAYVDWLRGQGVEAIEYRSASGAKLVANAKAEVSLRNPVLLTIPGYWTGNYAGWDMVYFPRGTHEVVACDVGPGWLTCMNPWPSDGRHAFYQRQSDAWWAARICYGREFTCRRVVTPAQAAAQEEAAELAPLQKRISELETALAAAQVDKKRVADADALVRALNARLAA